jgi:hypothetical protein
MVYLGPPKDERSGVSGIWSWATGRRMVAPHEAGHLMALKDEYNENTRLPTNGDWMSNLMSADGESVRNGQACHILEHFGLGKIMTKAGLPSEFKVAGLVDAGIVENEGDIGWSGRSTD